MTNLPVSAVKDAILKMYQEHDTLIVIGDTGSGKTTQIPQFIYELENNNRNNIKNSAINKISNNNNINITNKINKNNIQRRICVTQPRRVAAMSLAKRVAQEMGVPLGGLVGFSVRFEEMTSWETQIKYLTDGMLLRELLSDPKLSNYGIIILDEAHERTLRTDILFGMIKRIQIERSLSGNPLKVVIMSATLDPKKFISFFRNVGVFRVPGRMYPVKLLYTVEPVQDYIDTVILTIFQIHSAASSLDSNDGDILVFLTGQEEIEAVQRTLEEYSPLCPAGSPKMIICPLYAALPSHLQLQVFQGTPSGCRKVILATNIAETSITISGVRHVIDCGFVKMRQFSARTGLEALQIQPICKSSARQRTGRAGREAPGNCYRLYPEESFLKLEDEAVPEILRTNLSSVILTMKAGGIDDILKFDYLDAPGLEALQRGLEELLALGALEPVKGALTGKGRLMAECPLIPQLSRVLLEASRLNCLDEALSIVSMLSVLETLFFSSGDEREAAAAARKTFKHPSGDHLTLLNVYCAHQAHMNDTKWCTDNFIDPRSMKHVSDVRKQLLDFCLKNNLKISSCQGAAEPILKAFLAGYFMQTAIRLADGTFKSVVSKQHVHVHPSSILFSTRPDCIFFHEITLTSKCYLRGVSVIEPSWIQEVNKIDTSSTENSSKKGIKSILF